MKLHHTLTLPDDTPAPVLAALAAAGWVADPVPPVPPVPPPPADGPVIELFDVVPRTIARGGTLTARYRVTGARWVRVVGLPVSDPAAGEFAWSPAGAGQYLATLLAEDEQGRKAERGVVVWIEPGTPVPPPVPPTPEWIHGPVSIAWHQVAAPGSGLEGEVLTTTVQFQAVVGG